MFCRRTIAAKDKEITNPLIVYDLVFATRGGKLTGIERYALNMFRAAAGRSQNVIGIVANRAGLTSDLPVIETGGFRKGWLNMRRFLAGVDRRNTVMICPSIPISPSMLMSPIPTARIIHDDFAWSRPKSLPISGRMLFRHYESLVMNRNRLLFAPTEIARSALSQTLARDDVLLSGNAPGIALSGPERRPPAVMEGLDFVLMVGTVEPRKNYERAIHLVESGKTAGKTIVVAGRGGWHTSVESLGNAAAGAKLIWLEDADDAQLRWLYRNCAVFLTLSHAEGFNMPLVEAGCFGAAALCSDIPIHRSVTPPWGRIIPVNASNDDIDSMLRNGYARPSDPAKYAKRFSWATIAQTVEDALIKRWREQAI